MAAFESVETAVQTMVQNGTSDLTAEQLAVDHFSNVYSLLLQYSIFLICVYVHFPVVYYFSQFLLWLYYGPLQNDK